jgi:hypothetical protein
VPSTSQQRAGRTEALFREVNQNIASLEESFGGATDEPVYICECERVGCAERLAIDPEAYRRARQEDRRFLLRPGHENLQIERVIERNPDYLVVEKTGEAGEVAEQAAP